VGKYVLNTEAAIRNKTVISKVSLKEVYVLYLMLNKLIVRSDDEQRQLESTKRVSKGGSKVKQW